MRETGMSPCDYIIDYKMKRAEKQLLKTNLSVGEIALSVGYADRLAFSKRFAKKMGMSPTEYRKSGGTVGEI